MFINVDQYDYYHFEEVDSTQEVSRKIIDDNAKNHKNYLILNAKNHLQGKGRGNKQWLSSEKDISFTFVYPYNSLDNKIVFLLALALKNIMQKYCSYKTFLCKWPNDIMVDDKKICGILVENYKNHFLIGIGINLIPKKDFISLQDFNITIHNHKKFIFEIVENYWQIHDDYLQKSFHYIKNLWLESAYKLNYQVSLEKFNGTKINGEFIGVNDQGEILIKTHEQQILSFIDCKKLSFI